MSGTVKPIPEGFRTLTPHLTVGDAMAAIEFYARAFGAELQDISHGPDNKVTHATLKIGDSLFMLNDEFPDWGVLSPLSSAGSGFALHLYVENVDTCFAQAVAAGATVKMPLADQFWGDRYGQVMDPYGHKWSLATRVRNVSEEDALKAQEEAFAKMPKSA
jgi:PhnB protein